MSEQPDWLSESLKIEIRVRVFGAAARTDDRVVPEEHMTLPMEKSRNGIEKNLKPNKDGSHESVGENGIYNVDENLYHAEKVGDRLVERPEWLPLGWGFKWKVQIAGKTSSRVDKVNSSVC
ncbi:hypothetical protein ACH5RR_021181 [Cinchona calisaya]|uniref:Uncharacterized protein n=1 Tax=Cinchona calisaya TaxID=153742 RepID=A0ABD2ZGK4_9GENT